MLSSVQFPLTRHPDIDRIAFTGGPETARHVVRNSARKLREVTTLELGGKSPIIVFEDSDLDGAANGLIAGNFGASGQSCVAGSRGLIQRSIFESLIEKIEQKVQGINVGDPLDASVQIGPLCTRQQIDKIQAALAASTAAGARIRFGGAPLDTPGNYMAPTLVECPHPDIETLQVEMFGPIMSLIAFDTEQEAIELANSTPLDWDPVCSLRIWPEPIGVVSIKGRYLLGQHLSSDLADRPFWGV